MNDLKIFENPQFGTIRTIEENDRVLFCGSDVAKALGYVNPRKALDDHCKGVTKRDTPTNGGVQQMNFITEGDIYRLAAKSELPGAGEFESWIFDEVLPSIRRHGAYIAPDTLENMIASPEFGIKLLTALKDEKDRSAALAAANSELAVQVAIIEPKGRYFDFLVDRGLLTSFRDTAKELGIREREFVNFLLDKGYVYRDKKGKLVPYAEKNKDGYFELKECYNEKTSWSGVQTLVTPRGREAFRMLILGS